MQVNDIQPGAYKSHEGGRRSQVSPAGIGRGDDADVEGFRAPPLPRTHDPSARSSFACA